MTGKLMASFPLVSALPCEDHPRRRSAIAALGIRRMQLRAAGRFANRHALAFFRLCCTFAVTMPAHAATITSIPSGDDPASGLIMISGEIVAGDAEKFRAEALKLRNATVGLSSGGRTLGPALEIGKMVRLMSFSTIVVGSDQCASACALIWMAGARRFLGDGARVGFHAAYRSETGVPVESGVANAIIGAYVTQLGYPSSTAAFVAQASPTDMTWLCDDNARAAGLSFERRGAATAPASSTTFPSPAPPTPSPLAGSNAPAPLYRHFPIAVYAGPHAPVTLRTKTAYAYRTRLREGAQGPINFAGRYKVVTWGCGTSCTTGAIIDAISGDVAFLPSVCCEDWPTDANFERVNTRPDSRLAVLAGQLNETGFNGLHYFVMESGRLTSIAARRPKGR